MDTPTDRHLDANARRLAFEALHNWTETTDGEMLQFFIDSGIEPEEAARLLTLRPVAFSMPIDAGIVVLCNVLEDGTSPEIVRAAIAVKIQTWFREKKRGYDYTAKAVELLTSGKIGPQDWENLLYTYDCNPEDAAHPEDVNREIFAALKRVTEKGETQRHAVGKDARKKRRQAEARQDFGRSCDPDAEAHAIESGQW